MSSLVKGAWFVAARAWLEAHSSLEATTRALPPDVRQVLLEPIPAEWYPEETLQTALRVMRQEIAPDRAHFVAVIDGCTEIGISRFFRALLRVVSPAFVLRQVPTMWRQIRRDDTRVTVEVNENRAVIHYAGFPYFADDNYRALTEGSLRAVVRTSTGRDPKVTILHATKDSLDVEVVWRATAELHGDFRRK